MEKSRSVRSIWGTEAISACARLAITQAALLRRAATALRPGGVLVYSTCTLLPEENESIVESFLDEVEGFTRAPVSSLPDEVRTVMGSDGYMRCLPHGHGR